jgi:hypothetical protein
MQNHKYGTREGSRLKLSTCLCYLLWIQSHYMWIIQGRIYYLVSFISKLIHQLPNLKFSWILGKERKLWKVYGNVRS